MNRHEWFLQYKKKLQELQEANTKKREAEKRQKEKK